MKARILVLLLAAVSASAFARWDPVVTKEGVTVYVDRASARVHGNVVRVWSIEDFSTPQEDPAASGPYKGPYQSLNVENEFNCANGTARRASVVFYSGQMRTGRTVGLVADAVGFIVSRPAPVRPDSTDRALFELVCGG